MIFTDNKLLLEVYLKHHLQDKVMPNATLYEIAPFLASMMNHLSGVAGILKAQGAPEYLVNAGLFHSVYGEEHSRTRSMDSVFSREKLKEIIGERAEEIVYQFATIPFDRTKNIKAMAESELASDLRWLDIANEMDMKGLKNEAI
jgi:hypothetical protein